MSVFIRRKKRLFEADGEQSQLQQTAQLGTLNTDVTQQENQQVQPTELQQKVTACINNITEIIKKNDPYALIALDLPSMIQLQVPDFKADNATAKDAIGAWDAFKQGANKDNFDKFMNAFATFGNGGPEAEKKQQEAQLQNALQNQQSNNQPALNTQQANQPTTNATQLNNNLSAPATNTTQTAQQSTLTAPAQTTSNNTQDVSNSLRTLTNHLQGESLNNKFRDMLKENLQASLKKDRYEDILKNGWHDPEKIFI